MSDLPQTSLQNTEGLYQQLFHSAPDLLLMIDREGWIEIANSRCMYVLKISPDYLHCHSVSSLLDPSCLSEFAALLTGLCPGAMLPGL